MEPQRANVWWVVWTVVGSVLVGALWAGPAPAREDEPIVTAGRVEATGRDRVRYGRDIRPILSDRCFMCHGMDADKRKAGLRLDEAGSAKAERDGIFAIAPGDLAASEVWQRINSEDETAVMPPPHSGKKGLSAAEKDLVRRWIEQGAGYEAHWSFVPPVRAKVPESVEGAARSDHPIDRFIDVALREAGLARSAPAGSATLLRRLFLDLTGLPPTPDEVARFVADDAPGAYERWVDRLLKEEPYRSRTAERLATPWLDQARYADTCGIHHDHGRSIWPYRDWVLGALANNLPVDRFVVDQLAGDLIPGATAAQTIATGFNRNTATSDEGGAIDAEYRFEYIVERASVTGSVFLGLTVGCARCHDHKFDPVSMDDFYALGAFYNSLDEPGVYLHSQDKKHAYTPAMPVASEAVAATIASLGTRLAEAQAALAVITPEEAALAKGYPSALQNETGTKWFETKTVSAESKGGATLNVQSDGSVLATGENPASDEYAIVLETTGGDLRLLLLEALTDPSVPNDRVGRNQNGNAVVSRVAVEAVSVVDPTVKKNVRFTWAWADIEQKDGDFSVVNTLVPGAPGWAVDGHRTPGGRTALFLAEEPFGFVGGTRLHVTVGFNSAYPHHSLGRVRLTPGTIAAAGLERLPVVKSGWYIAGPFEAPDRETVFEHKDGPEADTTLDLTTKFAGDKKWAFTDRIVEGTPVVLPAGVSNQYVARRWHAPSARTTKVSLGSDDGLEVFVRGVSQHAHKIERSLAPDQESATLTLAPGVSAVTMKIVNTGGDAGVYFKDGAPGPDVLAHGLVAALLPESALAPGRRAGIEALALSNASPRHRDLAAQERTLTSELAAAEAGLPRTMVMKELPTPRPMFVMRRGQYDQPDQTRPVLPAVPRFLGEIGGAEKRDRLALARWLVSDENPLTARVFVNRVWEQFFGTGLVKTSEDFGYQGEYPSHPELLDWLAVEFREGGWDRHALMKLIVTSATYRQDGRRKAEAVAIDPDNRLLAYFPRQRLSAEQIRDQALFVSGLLVEKMGGPSVQPPQPAGLWEEVSMLDSSTRVFEAGPGDERVRRSLYTFWKRASPPPTMLAFDAPTREFCTVKRTNTTTPLQALALWNDEQFVEAARVLAARVLLAPGDDRSRLNELVIRVTGEEPRDPARAELLAALSAFRERYRGAKVDAEALVSVGPAARDPGLDSAELAAWTMISSALLCSDAALVKD